jgi:predicted transcriptional regulator
MPMQSGNAKAEAHKLIDQLPDDATWDQLAYHVEVRASIERGLADVRAGRTLSHDEIKREFGIRE